MVAGEAEAVVDLRTDAAVWEHRATLTVEGRQAMLDHVALGLSHADFGEIRPLSVDAEDGVVTVVWVWSGTSSVESRGPEDKTPFSTKAATVFESEDGLITRSALDYEYDDLFA
jgi:hypothetical protein